MTITSKPRTTHERHSVDLARDTARRPQRLILRRRLLLWSAPAVALLLLLAVKMASVGILGNALPGQYAAHDADAMDATLRQIDIGGVGSGYRELFAAGDRDILNGDAVAALANFQAAHNKSPSACPPRVNLALTAELLSGRELARGNFFKARTLLEPVVTVANEDTACFENSQPADADAKTFVAQTPQRLTKKLRAIKGGAITLTPDGYDYLRAPGGDLVDIGPAQAVPCPLAGEDDARLRDCVKQRDDERKQKQAQLQREQDQPPQPGQPPEPPPDDPAPVPEQPPPPADPEIKFPAPLQPIVDDPNGVPMVPFCDGNGTPLGDLGAVLCTTSGPLP